MRSLLIVVMLACSAPLAAAEEPHPDWRLVANSTSIVVGKLYVPVDVIEETLRAGERRYVPMFIEPEQVLVGDDRPKFDVRYFVDGERDYALSADVVIDSNAHRILAFLEEGSDGNLYFNGTSCGIRTPQT